MKRPIVGFRRDAEDHWVAELSCGHPQHVRHDPPRIERPWVLSEAGRASRLGVLLDCVRCDAREMPEGFTAYKRTATFDERTVPAGLLANHTTKAGVWAQIHVERGELRYRIEPPFAVDETLSPNRIGIVLPEVEHRVTPLGEVAFHVEFWKCAE